MSGVFGESLEGSAYQRYVRVQIARETGWSLAYIDSLPLADWLDVVGVLYGEADLKQCLMVNGKL